MSAPMIMMGETLGYKKQLAVKSREYCQVHEHDKPKTVRSPGLKAPSVLFPVEANKGAIDS